MLPLIDPVNKPIARHEMALGLMLLFRALPDGARRHEIVLEQQFAGTTVRAMGVELSAFDQSVLFAVLEIAGAGGENVRTVPTSQTRLVPAPPRGMRASDNLALEAPAAEVSIDLPDLLRHMGRDASRVGGETRRSVQIALQRLGGLTIAATQADTKGGFTSLLRADWDGNKVIVTINPRSTAALFALRGYAAINMRAYRALSTPTARVMYAWLCAWYAGTSGNRCIGLERLELHVFGTATQDRKTRHRRRELMRAAAEQIARHSDMQCAVIAGDLQITRGSRAVDNSRAVDICQPSEGRSLSEKQPVIVSLQ